MATFILLGLGSIYELQLLTFSSLVTLMVGLFFGKEVLERLDFADQLLDEIMEDDEIVDFSDDIHFIDVINEDRP